MHNVRSVQTAHAGRQGSIRLAFWAIVSVATQPVCAGDVIYQTIATMGETALENYSTRYDGTNPGAAKFDSFGLPYITGEGQIMFSSQLAPEDETPRSSIWTTHVLDEHVPSVPDPNAAVKFGDLAPKGNDFHWNFAPAPNPFYESIVPEGVFDSGQILFKSRRADLTSGGVVYSQPDQNFIWSTTAKGTLQNSAAVYVDKQPHAVSLRATSDAGYAAQLVQQDGGEEILFGGGTVILSTDGVPGAEDGRFESFTFLGSGDYGFESTGEMYFRADVTVPNNNNPATGIYLANLGLSRVVAENTTVAIRIGDTGTVFEERVLTQIEDIIPLQLPNSGGVVFRGEHSGGPGAPTRGVFLAGVERFSDPSGQGNDQAVLKSLVLSGVQTDVSINHASEPVIFGEVDDFLVGPEGRFYFEAEAEIRKVGQLGIYRNYVWEVADNEPPRAIAEAGFSLEVGGSVAFGDAFSLVDVNATGDLLFSNRLESSDSQVNSGNDDALFIYQPDPLNPLGKPQLLVREGDPDYDFGFPQVRRGQALSDDGHVLFLSGGSDVVLARVTPDYVEDFIWSGVCGDANWHATCEDSNWLDARTTDPAGYPPGDGAGLETATILADDFATIFDRAVHLKSLRGEGSVGIIELLTLDRPSHIGTAFIESDLKIGNEFAVETATWSSGEIGATKPSLVASRTSRLKVESGGRLEIRGAASLGLATNVENHGDVALTSDVVLFEISGGARFRNFGSYTQDGVIVALDDGSVFENEGSLTFSGPSPAVVGDFNITGGTVTTNASTHAAIEGNGVHSGAKLVTEADGSITLGGRDHIPTGGKHTVKADRMVQGADVNFLSEGAGSMVLSRSEFIVSSGAVAEIDNSRMELALVNIQGMLRTTGDVTFESGQITMGPQGKLENSGRFRFQKKDPEGPGDAPFVMDGTFVNKSSATLFQSDLLLLDQTRIENEAGATFRIGLDSKLTTPGENVATAHFVNQGTLLGDGSNRGSELHVQLENTGSIAVQHGELAIFGDATHDSAGFEFSSDAKLILSGEQTFTGATPVLGPGTLRLDGDASLDGMLTNESTIEHVSGHTLEFINQAQIVNKKTYRIQGNVDFTGSSRAFENEEGARLIVEPYMADGSTTPGNTTIQLLDNQGSTEVVGENSQLTAITAEQLDVIDIGILRIADLTGGEWIVDDARLYFGESDERASIRVIGEDAEVKLVNSGLMEFINPFVNNGRLELTSSAYNGPLLRGPVENNGTLLMMDSDLEVLPLFENNGILRLTDKSTLSVEDEFENNNFLFVEVGSSIMLLNGEFTTTEGSTTVIHGEVAADVYEHHKGAFHGSGKIDGFRFNVFGAKVGPGSSPGTLSLDVDEYEQDGESVLEIELAGVAAGEEHDQLAITGSAAIDGELEVLFLDEFVPAPNDVFTVLTADGGVTGVFANTADNQLLFPFGSFDVAYNANSIELLNFQFNPIDGDFDGDGFVGGSDFVAWQRGQSPNPFSATDLALWEASFGNVVTSPANPATIPEPATWLLLCIAAVTLTRFAALRTDTLR